MGTDTQIVKIESEPSIEDLIDKQRRLLPPKCKSVAKTGTELGESTNTHPKEIG